MWEYDDLSIPYENEQPQTYLSLVASDTIYAHLDSTTGEFTYAIGERPPGDIVWDTLDYAFTTVFTSKQELHCRSSSCSSPLNCFGLLPLLNYFELE